MALVAVIVIAAGAALAGGLAARAGTGTPDGASRLVPADALLYVHAATGSRLDDQRLWTFAERLQSARELRRRLASALPEALGGLDLGRDVRPWIGDEAAVALVDVGWPAPAPLLLAAVRDRSGAERALGRLQTTPAGTYRGTPLQTVPGTPVMTAAFAGDFLAVGPDTAVRAVVDRAAGRGPALAGEPAYRRAAAARSGTGTVDVYAPATGVRRLLAGRDGAAGLLARLLAGPRVEGVAAQLGPEPGGVQLGARILRARGAPEQRTFAPALTDRVPADAAAYLALPGAGAAAGLLAAPGRGSAACATPCRTRRGSTSTTTSWPRSPPRPASA